LACHAEVIVSAGKRIFAVVIIVLSIVGIVLCVGGIIGTWIVEDRLTRITGSLLSSAEEMLQTLGNGLDRVDTTVQEARDSIADIERLAKGLGDKAKNSNLILVAIEQALSEREFPKLQRVQTTVQGLAESIVAFNKTLEAINAIPGVEVPTLTKSLNATQDRIDTALQPVQDLVTKVEQMKIGVVDASVEFVTTYTVKADTALKTVQADVQEYLAQVRKLEGLVSAAKARLPFYFLVGAAAITLALLLFLWGQARLLIYGLMVWRAKAAPELPPSGDVAPPQLPTGGDA
jgi:ABC-type transporter Mla subunit MlaD